MIGFDIDKDKIKRLSSENIDLEFTSDPFKVKLANFVIITVSTPVSKSKEPDLSFIKSAASIVGQNLNRYQII